MQAINRPYTQLINGSTQFIIPVFQRDYSWGDIQCQQLWDDLIRAAKPQSGQGHFLGSIVYIATGDNAAGFTRWLVIDGQQRLATLTLLLTALRDHIKETGWSGGEDSPTVQQINAYFLKNIQESGNRQAKLVLRRADNETLQALINGSNLPKIKSEPIVDSYQFFKDLLPGIDPEYVYRGINRLVIIDVTLDRNTDDLQLVFESLNSTGVALSQADQIRNFVLMRLPEGDQTRIYEKYWSKIESLFRESSSTFDSFIRDYMALRTEAIKQTRADQIYQVFKDASVTFRKEDGGLEEMLGDMEHAANHYAAFNPGSDGNGAYEFSLRNLRHLAPVASILVTKLYQFNDGTNTLSNEEFLGSLELIESYVFRRAICGFETRGYWNIFANLAYQIDSKNPFQSLQVELASLPENYHFPPDAEFKQALIENDLYGLRVCRHLLERLENAGSKELSDTSNYSIEHVMPQNDKVPLAWRRMLGPNWRSDHDTWVHRLGNLTLTGYNSKYQDRPFEEKKSIEGGFNESAVRLNKYIRERSKWTVTEIEARGQELARRALKIWPTPEVDPSLIEAANYRHIRKSASKSDVKQVVMSTEARELFNSLSNKIKGLGDVIEFADYKSVSYFAPNFFIEVLPRKYSLTLLLPMELSEVSDPNNIAEDANDWKFITNATHNGDVIIQVENNEKIDLAIPIIRQALNMSLTG